MAVTPRAGMDASRAPRLPPTLALLCDLGSLVLALAVAILASALWLLARSDRGRFDAPANDALVVTAAIAALLPAWVAWQWLALWREGATVCGRRLHLPSRRPHGTARSALWLALHPVTVPGVLWLLPALLLAGANAFAAAVAAVAALLVLLGLLSGVLSLLRPQRPPLHQRLALLGTRRLP